MERVILFKSFLGLEVSALRQKLSFFGKNLLTLGRKAYRQRKVVSTPGQKAK
jgi:hypothetical protein